MNKKNNPSLLDFAKKQTCDYCGKNPGPRQDNKNIWNGFYDKDMNLLVCWICRGRHYKAKSKTEFKNLYTEFPVPIINQ